MIEKTEEIEKAVEPIGGDEFLAKLLKAGAGTLAATLVGTGMLKTASTVFAKSKNVNVRISKSGDEYPRRNKKRS